MTKQLAVVGAAIMSTLLGLAVLWQFRSVVVIVLISLTLAAAMRPLVARLAGRSLLTRIGWILLYLVALAGFGFLLFLVSEGIINEIQQLAQAVSVRNEWRLDLWFEGSLFEQALVARLPPPNKLFEAFTGDQGQLFPTAILSFTQSVGEVLRNIFAILILCIYWTIHQNHFERLWLSLLPSGQRTQARKIWHTLEPEIGATIRGDVIQSLLAGLLLGLGYWLLGSPYPVLLALAGALASLIPVVGVFLTVIPVFLVGSLNSVQLGLFTALYALVVWLVLGVWARPRLFNRRWDNSILTLLLLIPMADVFGLVGILVAPLVSVAGQILWNRLFSRRTVTEAVVQVSDLKARQERVWYTIKEMEEPPLVSVTHSMERLTLLIEKAEPILQASLPAEPPESFPSPQPVTAESGPSAVTEP